MRKRQDLDTRIGMIRDLEQSIADNTELIEMGEMEGDQSIVTEAEKALIAMKPKLAETEIETLLSGEADANDAYVQINAGAGGTESQDWASMLMRMYMRYANKYGYKAEVLDEHPGEEAGIKSCTLQIKGHNAYGKLKTESGVHRLVRISPYDSNARRHTSFSSVWVYPVVDDNIDIEIIDSRPEDRHLSRVGRRRPAHQHDRLAPSASPICPPASSSPARPSARSTRTAPPPSRC